MTYRYSTWSWTGTCPPSPPLATPLAHNIIKWSMQTFMILFNSLARVIGVFEGGQRGALPLLSVFLSLLKFFNDAVTKIQVASIEAGTVFIQ